MGIRIVKDGWPLILGSLLAGGVMALGCRWAGWERPAVWFFTAGVILCAFFLYFFRDPERQIPEDPQALVAGADGIIRAVETLREDKHLKTEAVRISIFLNPFDVHVNRSPMAGTIKHLSYTPGKHLLTISNASSEYNEHSSILIQGEKTNSLVRQIVGPIVRRVVYWLNLDQSIDKGGRIGMMKFGSRLDMYFPAADVQVTVKKGERVRAGETVVALLTKGGAV